MKERETRLISIENRFSPITEQYRNVRTSIQFASSSGQPLKLLLVTSTEQEEGKTTVAANLAVVMAEANKKILLIDGDLRRATAGKFFTTYSNRAAGLSTVKPFKARKLRAWIFYQRVRSRLIHPSC